MAISSKRKKALHGHYLFQREFRMCNCIGCGSSRSLLPQNPGNKYAFVPWIWRETTGSSDSCLSPQFPPWTMNELNIELSYTAFCWWSEKKKKFWKFLFRRSLPFSPAAGSIITPQDSRQRLMQLTGRSDDDDDMIICTPALHTAWCR